MLTLKGYRTMCGYTQEDVADYLGCSRPLYSFKESGSRSFSSAEKEAILEMFRKKKPNLTKEELFKDEIE